MDNNTNALDGWITVVYACSILNRGSSWLSWNWQRYGLQRRQVGRNYLYRRDEIEALAAALAEKLRAGGRG